MSSLLALILSVLPFEQRAATADFARQPPADRLYTRYLSLEHLPAEVRVEWEPVVKFTVPSASKELILDHQIPERVPGSNLYRINLQRLGWRWQDWVKVTEKYPYDNVYNPLWVRADWLVAELADTVNSKAYVTLLYSEPKIPKDLGEFEKFWGIDRKRQSGLLFGWIEEKSQVGKQGTRFIEHAERDAGSYWITKDVLKVERGRDPLDAPDGQFKFDGREAIVLIPKVSLRDGSRGGLQVYGLFNGQNKAVNDAPTALVEDYGRTLRDNAAIVNFASCVTCHVRGMNPPSVNGLRSLIVKGVQLKTYDKSAQESIEAFHLTDSGKQLNRDSEDYLTAVRACNGLTGEENAAGFKLALRDYFAPVTVERAASELYCTPDELRSAVSYASANRLELGVRVVGLSADEAVPRDTFAAEYLRLREYVTVWRRGK